MESDVMLYVVGSADENEVLLYRYGHGTAECWAGANLSSVVLALRDSLNILLKYIYLGLSHRLI